MKDLERIRLITVNFSTLQGLKMVPLGVLLTVVSLWANAGTGPRRDVLFPGGCVVLAFLVYWLVARYYARTYGTVQPTAAQRYGQVLRAILGGITGLVAFWADVTLKLPVSFIGLLFALAMPAEHLWLRRQFGIQMEPLYIYLSGFMAMFSLLPLIGFNWWQYLGIRSLLLGICTLTGILFIVTGIWAHVRLGRWLPTEQEVNHEQRV
jgi:hypothetical protein